jgi:hypothetical protein
VIEDSKPSPTKEDEPNIDDMIAEGEQISKRMDGLIEEEKQEN